MNKMIEKHSRSFLKLSIFVASKYFVHADSTKGNTSGWTDTASGQTSTTSGQTRTTSGQTDVQTSTMSG